MHSGILWLELFFLLFFIERLGKKFIFLELLALIAVTQWLFGPMMSEWLGVEMEVPFSSYFNYAFPATIAYLTGISMPLWRGQKFDQETKNVLDNLTIRYEKRHRWGIALIIIGLPFWMFQTIISDEFKYLFYLLAHLLMVGICLLLFTAYKWKYFWVLGGIGLLVVTTLLNGMIGSVVFWLVIIGVIYSSRNPKRIPLVVKIVGLLVGLWVLAALQAAKTDYRILAWDIDKSEVSSRVSYEVNQSPELFYQLFLEKITNPALLGSDKNIIAIAGRLNQGLLVSYTMDYIPDRRPYGMGEVTIGQTLIAFIPRMFWPNKPVVGQTAYFKEYTGLQLGRFHSATLGPIGDAYADFGQWGILFLGLFGLFISQLYSTIIKRAQSEPALLLWFMVLYFGTITVSEVSVAAYLNSVFKYVVFIFLVRYFLRELLKIRV